MTSAVGGSPASLVPLAQGHVDKAWHLADSCDVAHRGRRGPVAILCSNEPPTEGETDRHGCHWGEFAVIGAPLKISLCPPPTPRLPMML